MQRIATAERGVVSETHSCSQAVHVKVEGVAIRASQGVCEGEMVTAGFRFGEMVAVVAVAPCQGVVGQWDPVVLEVIAQAEGGVGDGSFA